MFRIIEFSCGFFSNFPLVHFNLLWEDSELVFHVLFIAVCLYLCPYVSVHPASSLNHWLFNFLGLLHIYCLFFANLNILLLKK